MDKRKKGNVIDFKTMQPVGEECGTADCAEECFLDEIAALTAVGITQDQGFNDFFAIITYQSRSGKRYMIVPREFADDFTGQGLADLAKDVYQHIDALPADMARQLSRSVVYFSGFQPESAEQLSSLDPESPLHLQLHTWFGGMSRVLPTSHALTGEYRDRPEDASHYYEHKATRALDLP